MKGNSSLSFDIHSLVRIKATGLIDEVILSLKKHINMFLVEVDNKNEYVDIELSQLAAYLRYDLIPFEKNIAEFWIKEHKAETFIIFGYRGTVDIAICLSNPIRLYYTPRSGCAGKLYGCLLFCIQIVLHKKQGLMFKGAALTSGSTNVILAGLSGSGKTTLILQMLKEGWDFLSNDFFILFNQKARLLRRDICVNQYHCLIYPWLAKGKTINRKLTRWVWFRKRIQSFAKKNIPSYALPRMQKIYNPILCMDVKDFFPDCNIIHLAEPTICIVLKYGSDFEFINVNKSEIIQDMSTIQSSTSFEFETIGRLLRFYGYKDYIETEKLLENNLRNECQFYKLIIPYTRDVTLLNQYFKQCLLRLM
jgi:hypothetical protein